VDEGAKSGFDIRFDGRDEILGHILESNGYSSMLTHITIIINNS
jgi:hypothetical protein